MADKKRIVVFGGRELAAKCMEILIQRDDVEIVGVLTRKETDNLWYGKEPCIEILKKYNLHRIETEDDVLDIDADMAFSFLHWNILKKHVIDHFKDGVINLHPAPLPMYRGCWTYQRAIINGDKQFAMTLHYIDPGTDTGDIIKVGWFDMDPNATLIEIYEQTLSQGIELFREMMPSILNGTAPRTTQQELLDKGQPTDFCLARAYKEKEVSLDWPPEKIYNFTRAMDSPVKQGLYKYEPAYLLINGRKVYLTVTEPKLFGK